MQTLADKIITDSLLLFRLSAGEQKKALNLLKKMQSELSAKFMDESIDKLSKARIEKLLKEADRVIKDYYQQIESGLNETLTGVAEHTASKTAAYISLSATLPTGNVLKSVVSDVLIMGSPSSEWWSKQADDVSFRFSAQVRQGIVNAETNSEIIKRVKNELQIPERNAAALVQTSVQAVANDARMATFQANDDVVDGVHQLSTLDSHTSDICMAYSGSEWDLKGNPINGTTLPFNGGPPRHFNCRSVLTPIMTDSFFGEDENRKRASEYGQISAKTTFGDFLGRKTKAEQDEMLGKGRADLWRSGKITLSDLVNNKGNPLTLKQLRSI